MGAVEGKDVVGKWVVGEAVGCVLGVCVGKRKGREGFVLVCGCVVFFFVCVWIFGLRLYSFECGGGSCSCCCSSSSCSCCMDMETKKYVECG